MEGKPLWISGLAEVEFAQFVWICAIVWVRRAHKIARSLSRPPDNCVTNFKLSEPRDFGELRLQIRAIRDGVGGTKSRGSLRSKQTFQTTNLRGLSIYQICAVHQVRAVYQVRVVCQICAIYQFTKFTWFTNGSPSLRGSPMAHQVRVVPQVRADAWFAKFTWFTNLPSSRASPSLRGSTNSSPNSSPSSRGL